MRLIDADALHDITKLYCENCEKRKGIKNGKLKFVYEIGDAPCKACQLYDMKDAIENAPTVDTERHGHWISDRLCSTSGGTYGVRRCSNCEYYYNDFGDEWNYCPNCGAKMDEVEE